ncbi:MAG: hypothetical protein JOZ01_06400 [Candidatus Eremiobacteraeota bacterium]|nr:hypothetical protein [Candidatus Eremiobacteraeota bacterium]
MRRLDDTAEALAAIAVVLNLYSRESRGCGGSTAMKTLESPVWSLAMRRSDLEFDDLLLLKSACSRRF